MDLMQLNDNKAGMKGLDKEKINAIIIENSKGSRFYENELKKEKILEKQIEHKLQHLKSLKENDIKKGDMECDKIIAQIVENQVFDKILVHVDMDAFYAAVEIREDPKLRHIPMAVGSDKMLSTSNYIARRFGVRAAMPGFIAKKLCPQLVIVDADYAKYTKVSAEIRRVFSEYDAYFSAVSLDEAYLDLTDHMKKRQSSTEKERTIKCPSYCRCKKKSTSDESDPQLAVCDNCGQLCKSGARKFSPTLEDALREIRYRIFCQSKLTASAGAGPNTLIAKIASDQKKPNGQFIVNGDADNISLFIRDLSIRKIPGIGKVSERKLQSYGVSTCSDLYTLRGSLYHLCSSAALNYYLRIALGMGDTSLDADSERKSRSVERTFRDISDQSVLLAKCSELSGILSADLKEEHIKGKTLTIKMKLSDFTIRTRAQTMELVTNEFPIIEACAKELLLNEVRVAASQKLSLRLLGLRMSSLVDEEMCSTTKQWTIREAFAAAKSLPKCIKSDTDDCPSSLQQETNQENVETVSGIIGDSYSVLSASPTYPSTSDTFLESECIENESIPLPEIEGNKTQSNSSAFIMGANSFRCPVCDKCICGVDANVHLDLCLSKSAIQEAIKESSLTNITNQTPKRSASTPARTPSTKKSKIQSRNKISKASPSRGPMDKFLKLT